MFAGTEMRMVWDIVKAKKRKKRRGPGDPEELRVLNGVAGVQELCHPNLAFEELTSVTRRRNRRPIHRTKIRLDY